MPAYTDETAVAVLERKCPEQVLEQLLRYSEELRTSSSALKGHCGLEKVAGAVKLVAPTQVPPRQIRALSLEPRVEVAVFTLSARQKGTHVPNELLDLAREPPHTVPRRGL